MPIVYVVLRDIFIRAGGANGILQHSKSMKHKKRAESHNEQPRLNVMKTRQSYLYSSVSWQIKKKRRRGRGRSKGEKLKEDTIRAEVMMVESIADLNLSMNAASTLTSASK